MYAILSNGEYVQLGIEDQHGMNVIGLLFWMWRLYHLYLLYLLFLYQTGIEKRIWKGYFKEKRRNILVSKLMAQKDVKQVMEGSSLRLWSWVAAVWLVEGVCFGTEADVCRLERCFGLWTFFLLVCWEDYIFKLCWDIRYCSDCVECVQLIFHMLMMCWWLQSVQCSVDIYVLH